MPDILGTVAVRVLQQLSLGHCTIALSGVHASALGPMCRCESSSREPFQTCIGEVPACMPLNTSSRNWYRGSEIVNVNYRLHCARMTEWTTSKVAAVLCLYSVGVRSVCECETWSCARLPTVTLYVQVRGPVQSKAFVSDPENATVSSFTPRPWSKGKACAASIRRSRKRDVAVFRTNRTR